MRGLPSARKSRYDVDRSHDRRHSGVLPSLSFRGKAAPTLEGRICAVQSFPPGYSQSRAIQNQDRRDILPGNNIQIVTMFSTYTVIVSLHPRAPALGATYV